MTIGNEDVNSQLIKLPGGAVASYHEPPDTPHEPNERCMVGLVDNVKGNMDMDATMCILLIEGGEVLLCLRGKRGNLSIGFDPKNGGTGAVIARKLAEIVYALSGRDETTGQVLKTPEEGEKE